MKKRWLCGTMALVIGAMAMAGCSGGGGGQGKGGPGPAPNPCSTCMWNRFSV